MDTWILSTTFILEMKISCKLAQMLLASVPAHLEHHWLLSSSLCISLAMEVPVKQLDVPRQVYNSIHVRLVHQGSRWHPTQSRDRTGLHHLSRTRRTRERGTCGLLLAYFRSVLAFSPERGRYYSPLFLEERGVIHSALWMKTRSSVS